MDILKAVNFFYDCIIGFMVGATVGLAKDDVDEFIYVTKNLGKVMAEGREEIDDMLGGEA